MSRLTRLSRRGALGAGALGFLAACERSPGPGRVRLAAGEPGGLYVAFAELLAAQVSQARPGLTLEVLRTEGSVDNLERLRAGQVDLALSLADVAELTGPSGSSGSPGSSGGSTTSERDEPLRALARVYENYLQVIVPASSPVRGVEDLRGRTVAAGAPGAGAAVTSQVLFAQTGLVDRVRLVRQPLRASVTDLRSGRVDAVIWSGGVPTPAIARLNQEFPVRLLDLGDQAAGMARRSDYDYLARRVPAVGYAAAGGRTIGVPDLLLCRSDLAGRPARVVVEVLVSRASHLVPPYVRGLQYLAPSAMIQTGRIPLHAAAAAVYRSLHG